MDAKLYTAVAAALILSGCVAPAPSLDAQMGKSVELAKAQQTLNPQASMDKRPVEMIDGKSANALVDRYHKGFESPTAINVFNIGVGGGGGSTLGATGGSSQ